MRLGKTGVVWSNGGVVWVENVWSGVKLGYFEEVWVVLG